MHHLELIKKIDQILAAMTEAQKEDWIRRHAMTLNHSGQLKFLEAARPPGASDFNYKEELNDFTAWCKMVNEGIFCLELINPEYDHDNDYDTNEYDGPGHHRNTGAFLDNADMRAHFDHVIDILEKLTDSSQFKNASRFFRLLDRLTIQVADSGGETWMELNAFQYLRQTRNRQIYHTYLRLRLFTIYHVSPAVVRAERILKNLLLDEYRSFTLTELMDSGSKELPTQDEFLDHFIELAKTQSGDKVSERLIEALLYGRSFAALLEEAKRCAKLHPLLYLHCCETLQARQQYEELTDLALDALLVLERPLMIRGKIARYAADAARKLGRERVNETCLLEAFYSSPSVLNFLKLHSCDNYQELTKKAIDYLEKIPTGERRSWGSEFDSHSTHQLSPLEKQILLLFQEQFIRAPALCQKDTRPLGWSHTLKGIAVPGLLLCLNAKSPTSTAGYQLLQQMWYSLHDSGDPQYHAFPEYWNLWKQHAALTLDALTREQLEEYYHWLKTEIGNRTEAIVKGQHRKSYAKAAALITALQECADHWKLETSDASLIEQYRQRFPKHTAFKKELSAMQS